MKRNIVLVCVLLLCSILLISCKQKPKTNADAIADGTFDWDAARDNCVKDIKPVLAAIIAGDETTYNAVRNEWLSRVKPEAQKSMFPDDVSHVQGCSASVDYIGYSGPEYNSENTEYLAFTVRRMNNNTLESVDFSIVVQLERGKDGYILAGFTKEVLS